MASLLAPDHFSPNDDAEALRKACQALNYYTKYTRENFVNYREVEANDDQALHELFLRAYNQSLWVPNKYSVDESATDKLKKICSA